MQSEIELAPLTPRTQLSRESARESVDFDELADILRDLKIKNNMNVTPRW